MTPPAGMEFNVFGQPPGRMDDPIGIFVVADLTGDAAAPGSVFRVGLDRLDSVMARLTPTLHLAAGQTVEFSELEDFHPDQLCKTIPYINELRGLLKRLESTDQFRGALSDMREMGLLVEAAAEASPPNAEGEADDSETADFARLLGGPAAVSDKATPRSKLDHMLGPIVAPHMIHGDDSARQGEAIDLVSARIAEALRAILHDDRFRGLESRWRGLHWLLTQLDAGAELHCYVFSSHREELSRLLDGGSVGLAQVFRDVMESQGLPAGRCGLLVDEDLACEEADVQLGEALGSLGRTLGMPVFTGAGDAVASLREPNADLDSAALWNRFRQHPDANAVIVGWPRFLARYPYGDIGEPIDAFDFDELGTPPDPSEFLWANSAYVLTVAYASRLLGQGSGQFTTEDIPVVSYQPDGEMWHVVTTREAISSPENLVDATGLSPVVGSKNRSLIAVPWLHPVSA